MCVFPPSLLFLPFRVVELDMGAQYALEGHTPNIHLGYSVEPSCLLQPFLPAPDRPSAPPQAYLMTKRLAFLNAAWPAHFFAAAQNATGISFVMGASWDGREGDGAEPPSMPEGVRNVGMMDQHAFLAEVARSRVLVGVGKPVACVALSLCSICCFADGDAL